MVRWLDAEQDQQHVTQPARRESSGHPSSARLRTRLRSFSELANGSSLADSLGSGGRASVPVGPALGNLNEGTVAEGTGPGEHGMRGERGSGEKERGEA
eukprot:1063581-Rhodomonas_salina.1